MSESVPVALFAYRRPDLLARCLASLRANNVPVIYAFSDGPRDETVAADVTQVRELLRGVDWARVEVIEAPRNLGVATSEFRGITHVLERHDAAVIVEEDLEFVPGTYAFLCAALERYRGDARVSGATAWAHPRLTPEGVTQPYFTGRMSSLMWATWRRAWRGVTETTSLELLAACRANGTDPARYGHDLAVPTADDEARGHWDLRFNLHMLANGGLFLFPPASMVRHTGYDARATNSTEGGRWEDVVAPAPRLEAVMWPEPVEHPEAGRLWQREVGPPPPTLFMRIRRRLRRLWSAR